MVPYLHPQFVMPLILIAPAFTLQAIFRSMSKVLTFMLTSCPRLANLLCICMCLPFLCYTLVMSLLLLEVDFGFNLISFWGCLKLVSCAFICFIGSFEPFKTKLGKAFRLPLDQIVQDSMDKSTRFFLLILPRWCLHNIRKGHSG
jgi:hypothetical protein